MNYNDRTTCEGKDNSLLKRWKKKIVVVAVAAVTGGMSMWYLFFSSFSSCTETRYLHIDTDDNIDSVKNKLTEMCQPRQMMGFNILSRITGYADCIRSGRYEVSPSTSTYSLIRAIKSGEQSPVKLSIPTTWTKEMAAAKIAKKLMVDSASISQAFNDQALCAAYGLDTNTIVTVLIPLTYEVYWNISPERFVERMYKESLAFWTNDRQNKANALNLNRVEIMTLASIVDAETDNDAEKPIIAGLYLNRLNKGMLLQSDPTVKYALRNFGLRRIYNDMLRTPSPYNTYVTQGLPPSPIRIPNVASIDAVLNYEKHDYLYMCAKEDFSGTHNYASTYSEHLNNAQKYVKALNARKIK